MSRKYPFDDHSSNSIFLTDKSLNWLKKKFKKKAYVPNIFPSTGELVSLQNRPFLLKVPNLGKAELDVDLNCNIKGT